MKGRRTVTADDPLSRDPEFCSWLKRNGVDPTATYRVDIGEDDMIVWRWHEVDGKKHIRCRCPSIIVADDAPRLLLSEDEKAGCREAPVIVAVETAPPECVA